MLELVLSPSLTVNSTCVGKLKLTADADVRTLSGTEGRPPGMSCGGAGVVPAHPAEYSKGLSDLDTHPFESTVVITISPPVI